MKIQSLRNKSVLFLAGYTLLVFSLSCKKVKDLFSFTITNECNITINSASPVNIPFVVSTPDVTTNSNQQFQNNNTSANLVKDIRLQNLKLTITNPSSQTFAFLKTIHIYISTNASNEIELASMDNITASTTTLELNATQAKLDEYIKASSYNLRTEVVTKQILTQ